MVQPHRKTVWWFSKKLNIGLPYNQTTPLLGIDPEEVKAGTQILKHECS